MASVSGTPVVGGVAGSGGVLGAAVAGPVVLRAPGVVRGPVIDVGEDGERWVPPAPVVVPSVPVARATGKGKVKQVDEKGSQREGEGVPIPASRQLPAVVMDVGTVEGEGQGDQALNRPLSRDKGRRGIEFYESARRTHAKGMRVLEALMEQELDKLTKRPGGVTASALVELVESDTFRYALEQSGRFAHSPAPKVGIQVEERRLLMDL